METNKNITTIPSPSSNKTPEYVKAMILARSEFSVPVFDRQGTKNKYATLKSIMNATYRQLEKHGLLFEQTESYCHEIGKVLLVTEITHFSGGYSRSIVPIDPESGSLQYRDKNTGEMRDLLGASQKYGCSLSYAKRYSAMTILGLYADEEDMDDYDYKEDLVPKKDIDEVVNKINIMSSKEPNIKIEAQKILGSTKSLYDISRIQYQKFLKLVG